MSCSCLNCTLSLYLLLKTSIKQHCFHEFDCYNNYLLKLAYKNPWLKSKWLPLTGILFQPMQEKVFLTLPHCLSKSNKKSIMIIHWTKQIWIIEHICNPILSTGSISCPSVVNFGFDPVNCVNHENMPLWEAAYCAIKGRTQSWTDRMAVKQG